MLQINKYYKSNLPNDLQNTVGFQSNNEFLIAPAPGDTRGIDEKLIWPVCPQVCYCADVGKIDQGAARTYVSVQFSPE